MICKDKKYQYANGEEAIILCYDRPRSPDAEIVSMRCNGVVLFHSKKTGKFHPNCEYDLVEVWEPQVGELCWFWTNKEDDLVLAYLDVAMTRSPEYIIRLHKSTGNGDYKTARKNCAKFYGKLP